MSCQSVFRVLSIIITAGLIGCATSHPTPTARQFNVRTFGATGDGKAKDTAAFQKAFDQCATAGGGDVTVPAGKFLIGSVEMHSNTTLRLEKDATVLGSPEINDYPLLPVRYEGETVQGHRALIYAHDANHLGIIGPGTLSGDMAIGDHRNPRGPLMVELVDCKDIHLEDFNDRYRRLWSIHLLYCDNVVAKNLNIRTTRSNGDGIDVDSTTNVHIDHCDIDTGDDSISLKSGRGVEAVKLARPTKNIVITDCIFGSDFAGIGIGTEMSAGISDVKIERCKFTRGANAIYIKSRTGRGGTFENITCRDLDVSSRTFLGIDLIKKGIAGTQPVPGSDGIPVVKNVSFTNVKVHCRRLVDGSHVLPDKPVDGLILANISGTSKRGITLANVTNAELKNITVTGFTQPLLMTQNVTGSGLEEAVQSPSHQPSVSPSWHDPVQLRYAFEQPPEDARPMTRWWWYGPAVTHTELDREMRSMDDGGFGGIEVQPTYPLTVDGKPKGLVNQKFLSAEFFDALKFTASNAKALGLRMDLTLGSGWPYGGPMFPITEAAGRLRIEKTQATDKTTVPAPALREGETFVAAFAGADAASMHEVPIKDGAAQLPDGSTGKMQVEFFISGRTGMKVKRPALGAEGYVIDHDDPAVVSKFIETIAKKEVEACGPNAPYSVFCDSLEVAGEDWTNTFLDEFQKRRGYDLRPLLPALSDDTIPKALDIRHDWGQTLTELLNDQFIVPLQKFSKDHNTKFRIQAYGSPSAGLFSYAYSDLPEGEGYQWHGYRATRYATSACHLMGIPVASSETFTWIHSPVFRATPLDIKAEADLHFLQGVNQIICHGWPYTPPGVADPGWSFYASGVFDEKNPWYVVMPDVNKYLQRVSFMMRQGQPANDIALYLANSDAWSQFTPGHISLSDGLGKCLGPKIVGKILDGGYNLDFFDDGMLDRFGKVDGGALAFGDVRYKVVVLAGVERIPASTMRKLEQFANAGGIVVATRRLPALAPGYQASEEDQKAVTDISQRLFSDPNAPGLFVSDENKLAEKLAAKLAPDVAFSPAAPQVRVVHRHTDAGEIYFLANTSNKPVNVKATFRTDGLQPQWWDPVSGRVTTARIVDRPAGGKGIVLNLEPYGSTILLWSKHNLAETPIARQVVSPAPIDLSTGWTVQFGKNPKTVPMEKLSSWVDDPATKNFSGVATYSKHFTVPAAMIGDGLTLSLALGEGKPAAVHPEGRAGTGFFADFDPPVREAAVIHVNGEMAGTIWCTPYSVEITGLLKAGENDIRIEVANTAVNSIAAKGFPNYDYQTLIDKFGVRFVAPKIEQFEPVPSGLFGPIQLIASKAE